MVISLVFSWILEHYQLVHPPFERNPEPLLSRLYKDSFHVCLGEFLGCALGLCWLFLGVQDVCQSSQQNVSSQCGL